MNGWRAAIAGALLVTAALVLSPGLSNADSVAAPRASQHEAVGPTAGHGEYLAGADGGVFAFGDAPFYGSLAGTHLAAPIVGIDAGYGGGYYLAAADGGVFTFGRAPFYGSLGGRALAAPIVAMALTPPSLPACPPPFTPTTCRPAGGYYLVGADGGVFAFGNAPYFGSLAGSRLTAPIVSIIPWLEPAPGAPVAGYILVGRDGGVFTFGQAPFQGSAAGQDLSAPIVGGSEFIFISSRPSQGYVLFGADGSIYAAPLEGPGGFTNETGAIPNLAAPVVGVGSDFVIGDVPAANTLVASDGGVFSLEHGPMSGSLAGVRLNSQIVDGVVW